MRFQTLVSYGGEVRVQVLDKNTHRRMSVTLNGPMHHTFCTKYFDPKGESLAAVGAHYLVETGELGYCQITVTGSNTSGYNGATCFWFAQEPIGEGKHLYLSKAVAPVRTLYSNAKVKVVELWY